MTYPDVVYNYKFPEDRYKPPVPDPQKPIICKGQVIKDAYVPAVISCRNGVPIEITEE